MRYSIGAKELLVSGILFMFAWVIAIVCKYNPDSIYAFVLPVHYLVMNLKRED